MGTEIVTASCRVRQIDPENRDERERSVPMEQNLVSPEPHYVPELDRTWTSAPAGARRSTRRRRTRFAAEHLFPVFRRSGRGPVADATYVECETDNGAPNGSTR